jgi:hypothetical protein
MTENGTITRFNFLLSFRDVGISRSSSVTSAAALDGDPFHFSRLLQFREEKIVFVQRGMAGGALSRFGVDVPVTESTSADFQHVAPVEIMDKLGVKPVAFHSGTAQRTICDLREAGKRWRRRFSRDLPLPGEQEIEEKRRDDENGGGEENFEHRHLPDLIS